MDRHIARTIVRNSAGDARVIWSIFSGYHPQELRESGVCTTLSDFVRKELSPKSDEDQFSPHNVNTFSKEMVMRFIK